MSARGWRLLAAGAVAGCSVAAAYAAVSPTPAPQVPERAERAQRPSSDAEPTAGEVDLAAVAAAVSHPVRRAGEALVVSDRAYEATFTDDGITFDPADAPAVEIASASTAQWRPATATNVVERALEPGLTERVTARDGEVEWDVVVEGPRDGGVTVVAAHDAARAPERVDGGWLWSDADGTGGVHLGELVVVDADGVELHRAVPEVDDSTITLRAPAEVLAGAAFPVTLDPVLSAVIDVVPAGIGPATGSQQFAGAAANGSTYLVAWSDFRYDVSPGIMASRVLSTGEVLDTIEVRQASFANTAQDPTVAPLGTGWIVAWNERNDIKAARIGADGTLLDTTPIVVSAAADQQTQPSIASDGTTAMVVWSDWRNATTTSGVHSSYGGDIYGARISAAGVVIDSAGIVISDAPNGQLAPVVAWNGTSFGVAWEDLRAVPVSSTPQPFDFQTRDVYAARVGVGGDVLDPAGVPVSTVAGGQREPQIAAVAGTNGGPFLIAWTDTRSGSQVVDVFGARLSAAGEVLDPGGVGLAATSMYENFPVVASEDGDFLVSWSASSSTSGHELRALHLGTDGSRREAEGFIVRSGPIGGAQLWAAASTGSSALLVERPYSNGHHVYGTLIDGVTATSVGAISRSPFGGKDGVAVAFDGTNYLAVWSQCCTDAPGSDVIATRVSPAGVVLDPAGIAIATSAGHEYNPVVAWDGSRFVVAWLGAGGATYRSVNPDGSVGSSGTVTAPANSSTGDVAIAAAGGKAVVAIQTGSSVIGAFLDGASATPITIATSAVFGEIGVAATADAFAVGWTASTYDVRVTRVSRAGAVLDPSGVVITSTATTERFASIASDGTNALVAWQDDSTTSTGGGLYAARIRTSDAVVLDQPVVRVLASGLSGMNVVWHGTHWILVHHMNNVFEGTRIYRMGAAPTPVTVASSLVATSRGALWMAPGVAKGPGDQVAVMSAPPRSGAPHYEGHVPQLQLLDKTGDLTIADASAVEGSVAELTVTISPASNETVQVGWATSPGTATAGSDYTTSSGTVTLLPGETSATIEVPVLDDLADEATETVTVTLSGADEALITDATATLSIIDDDEPDGDGDGWPNNLDSCPAIANPAQTDTDGDGSGDACDADDDGDGHSDAVEVAAGSDPLDAASIPETCNGIDDDGDGTIDDGVTTASYPDADADGFGGSPALLSCGVPAGNVTVAGDADDDDPTVHPGADELDDGKDNDQDGSVDEGLDGDGDGATPLAGGDCDDTDETVHPGAAEIADDGVDQDCSGIDLRTWFADEDADGFGDPTSTAEAEVAPVGTVAVGTDCDDTDGSVHPGAIEVVDDGIDQDCSGADRRTYHADDDGDGFGDPDATVAAEGAPVGTVEDSSDCDDTDEAVHPGATEVADDDVDQDCDGLDLRTYHADDDGDGFGDPNATSAVEADEPPAGHTDDGTDCDDTDASVHPGAIEVVDDGVDQNCSGADLRTYYVDLDADTYGDDAVSVQTEEGAPNEHVLDAGDCDDTDAAVNPGAVEVAGNDVDEDCDGLTAQLWFRDADDDTFGDPAVTSAAVSAPAGYVSDSTDCDDGDAFVNPAGVEVADDGIDQDCSGVDLVTWHRDSDADGFGDAADATVTEGEPPAGTVRDGSDCDDTDAAVHPGATEVADDGVDQDCSGVDLVTYYRDADGDTFGDPSISTATEDGPPVDHVAVGTDCDDAEANVHPGAEEIVGNDVDENCDGTTAKQWFADTDADGFGDAGTAMTGGGTAPTGHVADNTDCDDTDDAIHPGAIEVADDGIDQSCNGVDLITYFVDADGDAFGDVNGSQQSEAGAPTGYVAVAGDADDADASIHPGAAELCDAKDNDQDGLVDEGFADANGNGVPDCRDVDDDADDDGLPDERDPDVIGDVVASLPGSVFANKGSRPATLDRLEAIEAYIVSGSTSQAIKELDSLRKKVDGCNGTSRERADSNDWITTCTDQRRVRQLIDDLVAVLRAG